MFPDWAYLTFPDELTHWLGTVHGKHGLGTNTKMD